MAEKTFETYAREAESIKVTVKGRQGFAFSQYDDGNTDNPRTFTFGPEDMGEEVHRYIQSRNAFKITVHLDPHLKIDGTLPEWIEPGGSVTVKIVSKDSGYIFDYWSDRENYETDNPSTRTWTNVQEDIEVTAKECESYLFQVNISGTGSRAISLSTKTATCSKRRVKITNRRSHETWDGAAVTIPAGYVAYVDRVFTSGSTSAYDTLAVSGGNFTVTGDWIKGWIGRTKTSIPAYAFNRMFYNQTALISCQDSNYNMSLGEGAFYYLFYGCTGLTTCPRVTPTGSQVAPYGVCMFTFMKTSITGKGNNVFTNFSSYNSSGYQFYGAFDSCSKLTANPSGWFTWNSSHMAPYCYAYCFEYCTSITRVGYNYFCEGGSQIGYNYTSSSSAGFDSCFYGMFQYCTSIKSAYIWCGYMGSYSHAYMFNGCSNMTLLYVINGNSTYHSQGSHCFNMFVDVGLYAWLVWGKYGNSTSYTYTWQNCSDLGIINHTYINVLSMVGLSNTSQCWSEVYDWYNWDSYGKSRHNNMAMQYTSRPIYSAGRTSYSGSGYQDWLKISAGPTGSGGSGHYYYVLPQHYTGWVGRWQAWNSSWRSNWDGFSTWTWASKTMAASSSWASSCIILTENKSGGGHWSSWGFAMQSY